MTRPLAIFRNDKRAKPTLVALTARKVVAITVATPSYFQF